MSRTTQKPTREDIAMRNGNAFDIVVKRTLGTVVGGSGEHSPLEAAYLILANHPEPGEFEFTMPAKLSPTNAPMTVRITQEFEGLDEHGVPIRFE